MKLPGVALLTASKHGKTNAGSQHIAKRATTIAAAVIVAAVIVALVLNLPVLRERTVSGVVRCSSGADVTGVWVEVVSGDRATSGFSEELQLLAEGQLWYFSRAITARTYEFHVGCGGTPEDWGLQLYSPELETTMAELVCFDQEAEVDYGSCAVVFDGYDRTL